MELLDMFFKTKSPTIFQNYFINSPIKIPANSTVTIAKAIGEIGKVNKFFLKLTDKTIRINFSLDDKTFSYTPEELYELGKVVRIEDEMYLRIYNDESIPNNFVIIFESNTGNSFFTNSFSLIIHNPTTNNIYLNDKTYYIDYSIVHKQLQSEIFKLFKVK